jgi:hypothetical protein
VHRAEVRHVSQVVEALRHDGEAARLLQVQPGLGHQVAGGQKVVELLPDVHPVLVQGLLQVDRVREVDAGLVLPEVLLDDRLGALQVLLQSLLQQDKKDDGPCNERGFKKEASSTSNSINILVRT